MKPRFTGEQIIGMIREQEAGMPTAEVCRKHGLSPNTFYKFKSKYGGMNVSDAVNLRTLEDENAKLKRLLAEAMLDSEAFSRHRFEANTERATGGGSEGETGP